MHRNSTSLDTLRWSPWAPLLLAVAACEGPASLECTSDAECGLGFVCEAGACAAADIRLGPDTYEVEEGSDTRLDVLSNDDPGLSLDGFEAVDAAFGTLSVDGDSLRFAAGCVAGSETVRYFTRLGEPGEMGGPRFEGTLTLTVTDPGPPVAPEVVEVGTSTAGLVVRLLVPSENGPGSSCPARRLVVEAAAAADFADPNTAEVEVTGGVGDEAEVRVTAPASARVWVRARAVDDAGNASEPSQVTELDLSRGYTVEPEGSSYDFGEVALEATDTRVVTLTHSGSALPLTVLSAEVTGHPDFALDAGLPAEGAVLETVDGTTGTARVVVRYTANAAGRQEGRLTIQTDADGAARTLVLRLLGTGKTGVVARDDNPRVSADYVVPEESVRVLDVLANDGSTGGGALTISSHGGGDPVREVTADGREQLEVTTGCGALAPFSYTAEDEAGEQDTASVEVEVVDATRPEAPVNLTVSRASSGDVELSFVTPGENGPGSSCPVADYELRVADNPAMTGATVQTLPSNAAPGQPASASLSPMAGEVLYVELRARDAVGFGPAATGNLDLTVASALTPNRTRQSFGTVVQGDTRSETFTLTNQSPVVPLSVGPVAVSGDAAFSLTAGAGRHTLAPGDSLTVTVAYAPTSTGAHAGTLQIPGSTSYTVALDGTGEAAVDAVADTAAAVEGEAVTIDVLANDTARRSGASLVVASVSSSDAQISGNRVEYTARCGQGIQTFAYTASDGTFAGSAPVSVTVTDGGNPDAPTNLRAVASSTPNRVSLAFTAPPENPTGSCPVASYRLRVRDGSGMTTTQTFMSGASVGAAATEVLTLPWGDAYTLWLAGVDDAGSVGPESTLTVDLRRSARLASPSSEAFGTVRQPQAVSRTVTVNNPSGLVNLTVSAASISGSSDFTLVPAFTSQTVNAGRSLNLTVRYAPSGDGADSATLNLTTDGGNLSVALSGTGRRAVVAVDDTAAFEEEEGGTVNVLANDSAEASLTLQVGATTPRTSTGGGTVTVSPGSVTYAPPPATCAPTTDTFGYVAQAGSFSATANVAVTLRDTTAPAQISDLSVALGGTNQVNLSFTAPSENGASGQCSPVRYEVLRSTRADMSGATTVNLTSPVAVGSTESRSIAAPWGSQYFLQVVAVDDEGLRSPVQTPPIAVDLRRSTTLSPSDSEVNVGPVALRSTVTSTFTLTNTSPLVSVNITSVALSGASELTVVTGGGTGTLAPGATRDVVVRYAPTARAAHAATLTVQTNGGNHTVTLNGDILPNREPESLDAFANPRIVRAGNNTTLVIDVQDLDSNLPSFDDITSVTIDLGEIQGASSLAMTAQTSSNATTRRYTYGPISTTGLSQGGYVFPVRIVDRAGDERWDAVTMAVYTGTERAVGTGRTYSNIQSAIVAASSGDAVVLYDARYTGTGNINLVFGSNKDLVVGSNRGPSGTSIDCAQASGQRAFNFANTGQTNASVLIGLKIENCTTGGAIRVDRATLRLLNLAFESNLGIRADIETLSTVEAARLAFRGQSSSGSQSHTSASVNCDFCTVDASSADYYSFGRSRYFSSHGGGVNIGSAQLSRGVRIIEPMRAVGISNATQVVIIGNPAGAAASSITIGSGSSDVLIRDLNLSGTINLSGGSSLVESVQIHNVTTNSPDGITRFLGRVRNLVVTGCRATWGISSGTTSGIVVENATYVDNTWMTGFARIISASRFELTDSIVADTPAQLFDVGSRPTLVVRDTVLPSTFSSSQVTVAAGGLVNGGNGIACFTGNLDNNICASPNFTPGLLGDHYLGTSSPAINAGSRTAAQAELDDRTTQTNGCRDSGMVDLGYHYETTSTTSCP